MAKETINTNGVVGDTTPVMGDQNADVPLETIVSSPNEGDSVVNPEGNIATVTKDETTGDIINPVEEIAPTTVLDEATEVKKGISQAETDLKNVAVDENTNLDTLKSTTEAQIEETAKLKEDILKDSRDLIIDQGNEKIAKLEAQQKEQTDYLKAQAEISKNVAAADKDKLEAAAELQRVKDEQAIIQAKADVEIQRQQSAWAYQKLGLGFSSGIINQSQKIATDGITAIAAIKAQMSYNQRLLDVETSKINMEMDSIQLDYNNQINTVINSYSNQMDDIEDGIEKQIMDTQNNLLLNADEKDTKITELLNNYNTDKAALERQHIDDMLAIKDRGLAATKDIEVQLEKKKAEGLTNLSQSVLNGTTASMSDVEIANEEDRLGIPRGTIKQKQSELILGNMREIVDNTIGADFVINTPETIQNNAIALMKQGKTLEEATITATNNYVKNTAEYKNMTALKKAQIQDGLNEINGTGKYAPTSTQTIPGEMYAQLLGSGMKKTDVDAMIKSGQYDALSIMYKNSIKEQGIQGQEDAIENIKEGRASGETLNEVYSTQSNKLKSSMNTFMDFQNRGAYTTNGEDNGRDDIKEAVIGLKDKFSIDGLNGTQQKSYFQELIDTQGLGDAGENNDETGLYIKDDKLYLGVKAQTSRSKTGILKKGAFGKDEELLDFND